MTTSNQRAQVAGLRLRGSARDLASLFDVSAPAFSNWRSRHGEEFPTPVDPAAKQPEFDLEEIVVWARRTDTPARLLPKPAWWWARTVEAVRRTVDPTVPALGAPLTAAVEAARRFLVAVVLTRAVLNGGVRGIRRSPSRWATIRDATDPAPLLRHAARQLENEHENLGGLLVGPLSGIDLPPLALIDLLRRLDTASDEGLSAGDQVEVVLDGSSWGDPVSENATSVSLAQRVASAVGPPEARVLYDPCAGEGALVVACARQQASGVRVFAQDIDADALRTARSRFLLHGLDFEVGSPDRSSLGEDQFPKVRADLVVADPPVTGRSRIADWVEHALAHLADVGRALIVIPAHAVIEYKAARRRPEDELVELLHSLAKAGRVGSVTGVPSRFRRDVAGPVTIWELRQSGDREALVPVSWPVVAQLTTSSSPRRTLNDLWDEEVVGADELLVWLAGRVYDDQRPTVTRSPRPSRTEQITLLLEREADPDPAPRIPTALRRAIGELDDGLRPVLDRLPSEDQIDAREIRRQLDAIRMMLREMR